MIDKLKLTKRWRGANPRPLDKAYDRQHMLRGDETNLYTCEKDAFQFVNDISQRKTNRWEWCRGKALECQAFKTIGRGFAPRQLFLPLDAYMYT